MEMKIKENLIVTNCENAEKILKLIAGDESSIQMVKLFVNSHKKVQFYLNQKMDFSMFNSKKDPTLYCWVDTGYSDKSGTPIFMSLIKNSRDYGELTYGGYTVGTPDMLFKVAIEHDKKRNNGRNVNAIKRNELKFIENYQHSKILQKKIIPTSTSESEPVKKPIMKKADEMALEIKGNLLIDPWNETHGLSRFLKIIGTRLIQLIGKDERYYVQSEDKNRVIINTGLIDKYGTDILILYRYDTDVPDYVPESIIRSKMEYIQYGFSKSDTLKTLKPISFFNEDELHYFTSSMNDFDINTKSLIHIISERRMRFPKSLRNLTDEQIANKIRASLSFDLMMAERDANFIKPCYSGSTGRICWLFPLYLREIKEKPELILVVYKAPTSEFYEIKTIYPYSLCVADRITTTSLYSKVW